MRDFRQIVRWAMPGAISLALYVLLRGTADPVWSADLLSRALGTADAESAINTIGGIVGLGAAVTVFGFVFSTLHHILLNWFYPPFLCADLREAIRLSKLEVVDYENVAIDTKELSVTGAWIVVNVAWHSNKAKADGRVAAAEWRSETMYDIMHGAGATLIGIAGAVLVFAVQTWVPGAKSVVWATVAVLLAVFNLHGTGE